MAGASMFKEQVAEAKPRHPTSANEGSGCESLCMGFGVPEKLACVEDASLMP